MSDTAAHLVDHVFPERPVRQWVLSFPYNLRYLFAYNGKALSQALKIMIRVIRRYYIKKSVATIARINKANKLEGEKIGKIETGAVMLVQRFGGKINLNPHFHVLFLDGVFSEDGTWHGVTAPSDEDVAEIVTQIRIRVFRALEKKGYITGYNVNFDSDDLFNTHGALSELMLGSIQGVNCFGDNRGRKIQTIGKWGSAGWAELRGNRCAYKDGFSLHANVAITATDRKGLEHLCRYIARPPVASERLSVDEQGNILYEFKKPWNDGSTHAKFTPEELIGRLIALVPPPRTHLIRFFGVLAPHSKIRKKVVPLVDEKKNEKKAETKKVKRYKMEWAKLLKRVFLVEVTKCECGGTLKIIAAITTTKAITAILSHLSLPTEAPVVANARAPPQADMFDFF